MPSSALTQLDSDTVHYCVDEAGDPAQMIAFVSSAD
jgi:hypothetical protein